MARRLEKKIAVITGGGRGVGEAYALALAAEGARIVVNDVARSDALAVVDRIRSGGGSAIANDDDISIFDRAAKLMDEAEHTFGRVDILVANAGIIRPGPLHQINEKDWADTFAVHVHGTFNCYRHVAPRMIAQRGGSIITTGAGIGEGAADRVGTGLAAHPGLGSYRAAKAAILVLTLHAAGELQPFNINVNSIMPGATATPMQQAFYDSLRASGVAANPMDQGWPEPVPPDMVPALGVFLSSDEGRRFTGRAFQLYGREIRVAVAPTANSAILPSGDRWSVEELIEKVPAWLSS